MKRPDPMQGSLFGSDPQNPAPCPVPPGRVAEELPGQLFLPIVPVALPPLDVVAEAQEHALVVLRSGRFIDCAACQERGPYPCACDPYTCDVPPCQRCRGDRAGFAAYLDDGRLVCQPCSVDACARCSGSGVEPCPTRHEIGAAWCPTCHGAVDPCAACS